MDHLAASIWPKSGIRRTWKYDEVLGEFDFVQSPSSLKVMSQAVVLRTLVPLKFLPPAQIIKMDHYRRSHSTFFNVRIERRDLCRLLPKTKRRIARLPLPKTLLDDMLTSYCRYLVTNAFSRGLSQTLRKVAANLGPSPITRLLNNHIQGLLSKVVSECLRGRCLWHCGGEAQCVNNFVGMGQVVSEEGRVWMVTDLKHHDLWVYHRVVRQCLPSEFNMERIRDLTMDHTKHGEYGVFWLSR
jgi:hypothetical protein